MKLYPVVALGVLITGFFAQSAQSSDASASSKEGHGGKVVICPTAADPDQVVDILDYYEAKKLGISIDLGPGTLSVQEKVDLVIRRIERLQPYRARSYRILFNQIMQDLEILEKGFEQRGKILLFQDEPLKDVQDSLEEFIPACGGGRIQQVVLQRKPRFPEERLLTIYKKLWKGLSHDQKAGLILHELIYNEAIQIGQTDSVRVRYFNAKVSSANFEKLNTVDGNQIEELVGLSGFAGDKFIFRGLTLKKENIKLYPGSQLPYQAQIVSGSIPLPDGSMREVNEGTVGFTQDGRINYYEANFNFAPSMGLFGIFIPSNSRVKVIIFSAAEDPGASFIKIYDHDLVVKNPYPADGPRTYFELIVDLNGGASFERPQIAKLAQSHLLMWVANYKGDGHTYGFKVGGIFYKDVFQIIYDVADKKPRALFLNNGQYICFDEKSRQEACR